MRIGGVTALVGAGALTGVAIQAAAETQQRDTDNDWDDAGDHREAVTGRRDGAIVGASIAGGLGITALVISGRF